MTVDKTTILVVDDEEYVRKLLQRILEETGYGVVAAANGREALDKMSQTNVSRVLLDIMMPDLDGFQTLKLIRQQYEVPVIMLNIKKHVTALRGAFIRGAADYMSKPFRSLELLASIKVKLKHTGPRIT